MASNTGDGTKKRSKKTPWFKRGDRVMWVTAGSLGSPRHGTVRESFKKIGSGLYTQVWVNWDETPGSRDLIKVDWLTPEPVLDTLARVVPYKRGHLVKLAAEINWKDRQTGEEALIPAGTKGIVGSTTRRKKHQCAVEVTFDFLPKGDCLILYPSQITPA
jgi:hypothetical protein